MLTGANQPLVTRRPPSSLDVGKICTHGTHMVRNSVPTLTPAHGHRPDYSAPCAACAACAAAALLAPCRCQRRTVSGHTVAPRPRTLRPATDPAVRTHVPLGGHPRFEPNLNYLTHLSSYHSASNSSSAPATLGTTGSSSPRSCTSKPTPTSAPGWTPMTLVGEIFLLFARVRDPSFSGEMDPAPT